MAEGVRLESVCTCKGTVGSNPIPSANSQAHRSILSLTVERWQAKGLENYSERVQRLEEPHRFRPQRSAKRKVIM